MRYFHGEGKRRSYFEGWYFKHQNEEQTIALIPAYHVEQNGRASASIQVITDGQAWRAVFPASDFHAERDRFCVRIGDNAFRSDGIDIRLRTARLRMEGSLLFGPLTAPRSSTMGPFSHVPFLQCRHEVISLCHQVQGRFTVNGTPYEFAPGIGYIEGDRGVSFPEAYLWTQCSFFGGPHGKDCCVMLSIASVPFLGREFAGCICCVYDGETEYRLATYRGVRILRWDACEAIISQGPYTLEATLLNAKPQSLYAPNRGSMTRTIHESAACRVAYRFLNGKETILDVISDRAGFEFADKGVKSGR
ncbi:MAG: tocopherol cyclase family protein [Bacillota bacterium]